MTTLAAGSPSSRPSLLGRWPWWPRLAALDRDADRRRRAHGAGVRMSWLAARVGDRPALRAGRAAARRRADRLPCSSSSARSARWRRGPASATSTPSSRTATPTHRGARLVRRADPGIPGRDGSRRVRRQHRRHLGRDRGDHHRHRLPGRAPPHPHGVWRRPGSTSSICSVGIALAFLGTVLLYFAARHAGADARTRWTSTRCWRMPHRLDPAVTRLAGGLLLIGYGAKAGLSRSTPGWPTRTARRPHRSRR